MGLGAPLFFWSTIMRNQIAIALPSDKYNELVAKTKAFDNGDPSLPPCSSYFTTNSQEARDFSRWEECARHCLRRGCLNAVHNDTYDSRP